MLSRQYSSLASKKEDREQIFRCCEEDEEANDGLEDLLHCITCGKNFKNTKELVQHEGSKKHKENVELIAKQLNGIKLDVNEEKDYKIKSENGMNSSANPLFVEDGRCMHTSISSVSLPDDNTLKALEMISELESEGDPREEPNVNGSTEDRPPIVDSLIYLKLKEIRNRRISLPVKDKSKSPNYSQFKDEDEYGEDTITETLLPHDSMSLPRVKTKKQEMKDSVERCRSMKTSVSDSRLALGKSSITDSLKILRKRTATEGGKIRKKLFGGKSSGPCNDSR